MALLGHAEIGHSQLLSAILDSTRLLVLISDRRGLVRATNRAVERATGLSEEAFLRPIWELAAVADERANIQAAFDQRGPAVVPPSLLFHLISCGTTSRVVDWEVRQVDEGRKGEVLVFTGVDLSDRLAVEQHLRETEGLQRLVLDRLPAIVFATDRELRTTLSTGGALAAIGLDSGQIALVGTSLYSYFHTSDPTHPGIAPKLRALQGESTVYEMTWHGRNFHTRLDPLRDRSGKIVGCLGLSVDVTEQAKTAEALKASERRLRRFVESNIIGILFWDDQGRITEVNEAFLRLVGVTREELLARATLWEDLTPPEYRAIDERAFAELKAIGKCVPYEKEFLAKGGTRVPVLVGAAAIDGSTSGTPPGVAFIIDLREQVRLREARDQLLLKEQNARIETELANARLMLLVEGSKRLSRAMSASVTLDTLSSLVIPALADWSYVMHRGWDGGAPLVASAHGDPNRQHLLRRLQTFTPDPAAPEGVARVFRTGEVALYEDITNEQFSPSVRGWPIVGTRDAEYLEIFRELGMRSLLCVPIPGRSGVDAVMMLVSGADPRRYDQNDVILARDLASRAAVSLENGRLLSEALEAVRTRDEFLAVAAHELRTPLTSLTLQLQILRKAIERGRFEADAAHHGVTVADNQVRRLSRLVDSLLDVARLANDQLSIHVEELDLRQMVGSLVAALHADLQRAGCRLTVHAPEKVICRWDRVRIEQVLTNLLSNAMKFGAGRPIEVSVDATARDVRISVRDHGIGISREDQARIFGRFERAVPTRNFGGLGLGLYISAQILRLHRGSLRLESQPGQGACFTIDLPRGLPSPPLTAQLSP